MQNEHKKKRKWVHDHVVEILSLKYLSAGLFPKQSTYIYIYIYLTNMLFTVHLGSAGKIEDII